MKRGAMVRKNDFSHSAALLDVAASAQSGRHVELPFGD
jgi:hypothetical protein